MIDHTMRARMGLEYDKDGESASTGVVMESLLEELMSREFLARKVRTTSLPSPGLDFMSLPTIASFSTRT